ncbi:MAG TPA: hypothetical protein VFJ62_18300 [Usitatibacter sp.]|nr:hypothetical protein [Usitatibacter sp.]
MKKLAILATLCLLAACAETSVNNEGSEPRAEREYPTGSNIPRKQHTNDGAQVYDRDAVQRTQEGAGGVPQQR